MHRYHRSTALLISLVAVYAAACVDPPDMRNAVVGTGPDSGATAADASHGADARDTPDSPGISAPLTCITIQRGATGDIADTQIAANQPDKAFGNRPVANAGTSGGGERQILLRPDLDAVPAEAYITSATLALWQNNDGRADVRAHRVLAPWDEHTVTWSRFAGAFDAAVAASADNGGPGHTGPIAFDITGLVSAWVRGEQPNHGLLLAQASMRGPGKPGRGPGAFTRVRTGKAGNPAHRPLLEVCYSEARPPQGTSLLLQVLDTAGNPVPTAAVTMGDDVRVTDGAGRLLLENLAPGRVVARVAAPGHAAASVAVDLPAGAHAGIEALLHPLGPPVPFDAAAGAALERGGVRVHIPANALVDYKGEPVTGTVDATIVPLDPTVARRAELPGPLEAVTAAGGEVGLESFAMAEVSLWQDGLPVQLAAGARATMEMTLPDSLAGKVAAGDVIPAWWLDVDAGLWREDGAGTVVAVAGDPGTLAWVVEVGHFTWWNCDEPWTDKNCFDVTLVDELGNPVSNVHVGANGVSYVGTSTSRVTAGDGQACVETKLGESADILVGLSLLPARRVTGSGPAGDCAGMGAACTPITVVIPSGTVICTPGASVSCTYGGPSGTEDVGMCQAGAHYCNTDGESWSGCMGEVVPATETCATIFDDDCDGEANEIDAVDCECSGDETTACYSGPEDTLDVGICQAGVSTCIPEIGRFGACEGDVLPQEEDCSTLDVDEDCDGGASSGDDDDCYFG